MSPGEPNARRATTLSRRVVAVSEIAGGIALLIAFAMFLYNRSGLQYRWWYFLLGQAVGLAAIVGGASLWRGEESGRKLSLPLQAMQVLHVTLPGWGFGFLVGLHANLHVSAGGVGIDAGFHSYLNIFAGTAMPWKVAVNLFSVWALLVLVRGGRLVPRGEALPEAAAPLAPEDSGRNPADRAGATGPANPSL